MSRCCPPGSKSIGDFFNPLREFERGDRADRISPGNRNGFSILEAV